MEQNNKESNITKLKKTAEQKIKSKILKIIVSWIISNIVTIISVFAVAIIILFIIQLNMETVKKLWNSFTDTISQIFSSEGNTEQANRDNYSVTEELKAMIKISDDGLSFEQKSEFSKLMIQKLKDAQINTTQMKLTEEDYDPEVDATQLSDEELKNMVDKYIRAEMKTMFPKIDSKTGIDGIVKIKRTGYRVRANDEEYIDEELVYVPYSQLKAEAAAVVDDESIADEYLRHFSLNPDTFELCLLHEKRVYVWKEDEGHSGEPDTTQISFEMEEIEYQTALEAYATPVNFFISLHQIVDDVDLMNELVDKVKNSDLTLTYVEIPSTINSLWEYRGVLKTYEETETYTTVTAEKYEEVTKEDGTIERNLVDTYSNTSQSASTPQKKVAEEQLDTREKCKKYIEPKNPAYTRTVSSSGNLVVNTIDTWIYEANKEIKRGDKIPLAPGAEPPDGPYKGDDPGYQHVLVGTEPTSTPSSYYPHVPAGYENISTSSTLYRYHSKKYTITGINSKDGFSYSTNVVDISSKVKIDDVIEFLNKYPRAKNNLITSPSMFYYYLEQSENTQELEKQMKLVIEKITGVKQPEGRFEYFDDNNSFSNVVNRGEEIIAGTITIDGRTYTNYKQPPNSDWCGITCAAIVLSGYGYNITPSEIASQYGYNWRSALAKYLGGGGYVATHSGTGVEKIVSKSELENKIIAQVKAGKPTVIHIMPNRKGLYTTNSGHYIVLLSIREEAGDIQFLVSDPGGVYKGRGRNGWVSACKVFEYCDMYVKAG